MEDSTKIFSNLRLTKGENFMEKEIKVFFVDEVEKRKFIESFDFKDVSILKRESNEQSIKNSGNKIFIRKNKTLNDNIELWSVLTLLVSGGTLTAIVKCIGDIILKHFENSKTKITIQQGERKIELEYSKSENIKELVDGKFIESLFLPEEKEE